jgi:hypothetical protein
VILGRGNRHRLLSQASRRVSRAPADPGQEESHSRSKEPAHPNPRRAL